MKKATWPISDKAVMKSTANLLTFFVAQLLIGRALPSPGRSVFSCRHSWQVLHLDQRYYMYAYVSLEMFIIDSVEWLMVRYYGEGAPSGMDQTGVQIKTWQVLLFKLFFYHAASKTSQWHRRPQLWLWQVGIILGILDRFCIWISATI